LRMAPTITRRYTALFHRAMISPAIVSSALDITKVSDDLLR